jgi:hypothetical protein
MLHALRSFLHDFFDLFRDIPNRASGEYLEAKSARIIRNICASSFEAETEIVPFAVDLSSGVWNVSLHGTILVLSVLIVILGGFATASIWGPGPFAAWFGPIGPIPLPSMFLGFLMCCIVLVSRFLCDHIGWSLFSFFIPSADSANIIVSNVPRVKIDPTTDEKEEWKARLKAFNAKRFVAVVSHYDSARCLPGVKKFFLTPALKNGIGRIPTFACLAMGLCFLFSALDALLNFKLSHGLLGWLTLIVFAIGFCLTIIEAAAAGSSAHMPYCPGYNDNLSGGATALGTIALTLKPDETGHFPPRSKKIRSIFNGEGFTSTAFVCAFTGSEENGLHGGFGLAKTVIAAAEELYGAERVYIINLDTVSGSHLRVSSAERGFSGSKRGGDPEFARSVCEFLSGPVLPDKEMHAIFTHEERDIFLHRIQDGWGFTLEFAKGPLPSCTDMTALCRSRKLNGKAKAFSITSPADPFHDPLGRPRDYHRLSDNYDTLMDPKTPENFGSTVVLSVAVSKLLLAIDAGVFETDSI